VIVYIAPAASDSKGDDCDRHDDAIGYAYERQINIIKWVATNSFD